MGLVIKHTCEGKSHIKYIHNPQFEHILVGGFNPSEKYESQWEG